MCIIGLWLNAEVLITKWIILRTMSIYKRCGAANKKDLL
jgi:hypothetical protein